MLALACLLGGCQAAPKAEDDMQSMPNMEVETNGEYHKITAEEAWEMMAAQMVTVVDVRTAEEYSQGHIANAILVPNETIEAEAAAALTDLDATILVYCRSGRRSKEAAEKLLALGYQNVYDFGGIVDWPYDVVQE